MDQALLPAELNSNPQDPYASFRVSAYSKFCMNAKNLLPTNNDQNTTILYHYTTLEGFKSIIENGCLWGSNFAYLNDSTELLYGKNIVREIVEEKGFFQHGRYSEETRSIISGFLEVLG